MLPDWQLLIEFPHKEAKSSPTSRDFYEYFIFLLSALTYNAIKAPVTVASPS
jgi:hypothetical protein